MRKRTHISLQKIVIGVLCIHLIPLSLFLKSPSKKITNTPISIRTLTITPPSPPSKKPLPRKRKRVSQKKKIQKKKLLNQIAKSLENLTPPIKRKPKEIHLPKMISKQSRPPLSYGEFLISFLQESLELPEYGRVEIEIAINAKGSLKSVEILHTESEKNAEVLEEEIKKLSFPHLLSFGLKGSSHSFTITFSNKT